MREMLVPRLVNVTMAPGSTAPDASVTLPTTSAVVTGAPAGTMATTHMKTPTRIPKKTCREKFIVLLLGIEGESIANYFCFDVIVCRMLLRTIEGEQAFLS